MENNNVNISIFEKIDRVLKENDNRQNLINDNRPNMINELKKKYDTDTKLCWYDDIECARNLIDGALKKVISLEKVFRQNIHNYIGLSLVHGSCNFYGLNRGIGIDNPKHSIKLCDYEECLLDWLDDTIKHFQDLYFLTSLNLAEFRSSIQNCYFELKILVGKLWYAIDESLDLSMNVDFNEELFSEEEKEKYKKLSEIAPYDELRELLYGYEEIHSSVCSIGDYIFMYVNKYGI